MALRWRTGDHSKIEIASGFVSRVLCQAKASSKKTSVGRRRSFIFARRLLAASTATYPNALLRDGPPLHSVWSSSGWGLPSRPSHLGRWCALTAPFHPYHASTGWRTVRRSILCCTFPNLAAGRRYRPSCPTEPGLSSSRFDQRSSHPLAISIPKDDRRSTNRQDLRMV